MTSKTWIYVKSLEKNKFFDQHVPSTGSHENNVDGIEPKTSVLSSKIELPFSR